MVSGTVTPEKKLFDDNENQKQSKSESESPPTPMVEEEDNSSSYGDTVNLYDLLVTEGAQVYGQAEAICPVDNIPWLDLDLIEDGLKFYKRHYSTINITSWFTFTIGLTMKSTATLVYRMGDAMTPKGQLRRILITKHAFIQFYKVLMEKPQEINKFFQKMWKMHAFGSKVARRGKPLNELMPEPTKEEEELAKVIRKDLSYIYNPDEVTALKKIDTWAPEYPLNQLDMSLTTVNAFLGLVLRPRKFGLRDEDEIKGFLHIWAVIGRLFGVQDRFNICLKQDAKLYRQLGDNAVIGSLRNIDSHQVHLLRTSIEGVAIAAPFLTLRGYLYTLQKYVLGIEGYSGKELWSVMNWKDMIFVGFSKLYFVLIEYIPPITKLFDFLFFYVIQYSFWIYKPKSGDKL